jgi:hypothetical protein
MANIEEKISRTIYSSPEFENRIFDYKSMATDITWKTMAPRQ